MRGDSATSKLYWNGRRYVPTYNTVRRVLF
jgi:hypothetical protein